MKWSLILKFVGVFLIIVSLLALVVHKVDLAVAFNLINGIGAKYIVLFLALSVSTLFIKSLSYYLILKRAKITATYLQSTKIFFASQLMTPLPAGETGRVVLTTKETGADTAKVTGSVLTQAFLEILSAVVVALVGSMFFEFFRTPVLIALVILSFTIAVFVSEKVWTYVFGLLTKIKFFVRNKKNISDAYKTIRSHVFMKKTLIPNRNFVLILFLLIAGQIVGGVLLHYICLSLGLDLTILRSLFLYSAAVVIQGLLSVLPGGVGTTEGGVAGILLSFGSSYDTAVAVVIVYRLFTLLLYLALGFVFFMIFYRELLTDYLFRGISKSTLERNKQFISHAYFRIFAILLIVLGGTPFIGAFIQSDPRSIIFDSFFYNQIANGVHTHFLDSLIWPVDNNFLPFGIKHMPSYFLILNGLFLIYLVFRDRNKLLWALVAILLSFFMIPSFLYISNKYAFRQRPYLSLPNNLRQEYKDALKRWNSFPSGHTRDTALYSTIIAHFVPVVRFPLLLFTLFVAFSRVYTGAHFPTDVISGCIIGYLLGLAIVMTTEEIKKIVASFKNIYAKKSK
jgi:glycosyltransferase 2 family protein